MRAYRFRLYPSKSQEEQLVSYLRVQKNLWNSMLEKTKKKYEEEKKFFNKIELQKMAKGSGLYAQCAVAVAHRLHRAIMLKVCAKKKGLKWGFPRFKPLDQMKSIHYPQQGFRLEQKLVVSPFGEIPIVKHRNIRGQIRMLTIKRESSGKWFASFSVREDSCIPKQNSGPNVGLDLGLNNLATLSDGSKIPNPRQFRKLEKKLAYTQRRIFRKCKKSRNQQKAKRQVALVHESISNARKDFLQKQANLLLSKYSKIVMEDLRINEMSSKGHGKGIHDASWGLFTHMLCYKAESAGAEILFVDPRYTSQECSRCHAMVQKSLQERTHRCLSCGLILDRDVNAAINILARATVGKAGSNACRDGIEILSKKQEAAHHFEHVPQSTQTELLSDPMNKSPVHIC